MHAAPPSPVAEQNEEQMFVLTDKGIFRFSIVPNTNGSRFEFSLIVKTSNVVDFSIKPRSTMEDFDEPGTLLPIQYSEEMHDFYVIDSSSKTIKLASTTPNNTINESPFAEELDFFNPKSISFNREGKCIVADHQTRSIALIDQDGKSLNEYILPPNYRPLKVVVDEKEGCFLLCEPL